MFLLTFRDLQYRAMRFAVVIGATAVVFTLLLLMTGLSEQFEREPRETVAALGADTWLVRAGASGAFTSAATIDPAIADDVDGTADPVVIARHSMRAGGSDPEDIVVIGFTARGLGAPETVEGGLPKRPGEVVVADAAELSPGDDLVIGGRDYEVSGVTLDATMFAGMPLVFMGFGDAQKLVYRGQALATAVLVDGELGNVPEGFATLSNEEIAADATRPLEKSISSINLIRALLWVVAAMIIGAVVYLSAIERHRDFAVLKAVGASNRSLLGGLAFQGMLIALISASLAGVLQKLLLPVFPLHVHVTAATLILLPVAAVGVALLASVAGLRRVARADPATAFAGPGA